MRDTVIAIMIEKASAMEQLDEILSVKHVDMVQFGPCDYSINIGKPGQSGAPEVQNAQREMIEKALKKGVHPRVEIGSFEEAQDYLDMGVRHFCVGDDLSTIFEYTKHHGEKMKSLFADL
jgi:4-hydroxy-2-oxoheptanedioate aldolase